MNGLKLFRQRQIKIRVEGGGEKTSTPHLIDEFIPNYNFQAK